jgi:hypothetical protein
MISVRPSKIASLEQKGLTRRLCQCVGEAIADVQSGRVPPAAKQPKCFNRSFRLTQIDRYSLDFTVIEKHLQIGQSAGALAAEHHEGRFHQADG